MDPYVQDLLGYAHSWMRWSKAGSAAHNLTEGMMQEIASQIAAVGAPEGIEYHNADDLVTRVNQASVFALGHPAQIQSAIAANPTIFYGPTRFVSSPFPGHFVSM